MQRTSVAHSSNRACWLCLAFVATAIAAWAGCGLVPQTLPPESALGSGEPGGNDDAAATAGDAGSFNVGASGDAAVPPNGNPSGGGVSSTLGGGEDASATVAAPPEASADAAAEGDSGLAGEAGVEGDTGATGNAGTDAGADAMESDATSGEISDSGDNSNDASPADAQADGTPE
jgi:hypothetical protein